MLVKEKYAKELIELASSGNRVAVKESNKKIISCNKISCAECMFYDGSYCNDKAIVKYFNSKYVEPSLLSEIEYIILKIVVGKFDEYKYIARDEYESGTCGLTLYIDKPVKEYGSWGTTNRCRDFNMFSNLFQFIKWEDKEPYLIEDLLKNYEKEKNM